VAFKSIESSFVYRHLNQGNVITNNIHNILQNGIVLTQNNIDEAFMIISKNFKFPLKFKILEAVSSGEIVLIYSPQNAKLPNCMPFFLTRNKSGDVVAVIVVDIYGTMNKDNGHVNIDAKKLYCIMEAAYLSKLCYHYGNQIASRNIIITHGSSIYSNMFTRVLNKKYALNTDKNKMQKVLFLASKFYLVNILGLADTEMAFNYAIKNCVNGNLFILQKVNDLIKLEDYNDLSTFIQALTKKELNLGFKDLTVRNYLESYINMYDSSALLALESFPYLLYNVLSVVNGSYINNQYILEDIVDTHGVKLYADLANLNN